MSKRQKEQLLMIEQLNHFETFITFLSFHLVQKGMAINDFFNRYLAAPRPTSVISEGTASLTRG